MRLTDYFRMSKKNQLFGYANCEDGSRYHTQHKTYLTRMWRKCTFGSEIK